MSLPTSHSLDVPGARLYCEVQGSGLALMLIGHPRGQFGVRRDRAAARGGLHRRDLRPPRLRPQHNRRPRTGRRAGHAGRRRKPGAGGDWRRASTRVRQQRWCCHRTRPGRPPPRPRTNPRRPRAPLALLLPEAEEACARIHDIYHTYRNSGIGAAWQGFSTFTGINVRPQGEEVTSQPLSSEMAATSERFFGHGLLPITLYQPDFAALQAAPTRVMAAGGLHPRARSPSARLPRSPNASAPR